ncbi:MAG: IcmS [uncultured bacterium]|nr:MAG: IcmS [uncultured bacterium]
MELIGVLCSLVKQTEATFAFCGKPVTYEEVFSPTGLLPPIAQRADKICSLCLGYGVGASFIEDEKSLLGTKVQFDDITPDILRVAYIYDVILEIIEASYSKESVQLDELMYD